MRFYTESIFTHDVLIYLVIRPEMVTATYGKLFRIFYVVVACNIIENWLSILCLIHIEIYTFHRTFSVTFSIISPPFLYEML